MTQFLLITGKLRTIDVQKIESTIVEKDNKFLQRAIIDIFGYLDQGTYWYIHDKCTKATDTLFIKAQEIITNGYSFEHSDLGIALTILADQQLEFVMWYSDDWHDLPIVDNKEDLLTSVEKQLNQGSGEVYLQFQPLVVP